jgi:enoyl-[acyl-carrier protein] reductase III
MTTSLEFDGKTALVTGGSRGIGREIALDLARRGADVVINYFRNSGPARETTAEIESLGRRSISVKANVAEPERVADLFDQIGAEFGGLDILVNNAASGVQRSVIDLEPRHWDWTMNINTRGPWLCTQAAVPLMEGRGGHVINISSLGSQRVMSNYASVGVSKAALEALTRYLGVELAPRGIRVNCVSGGLVRTGALEHFEARDEMLDAAVRDTPAGRMVTPGDIARVVAFLASDAAEMIVGQTIVVDGGMGLVWRT